MGFELGPRTRRIVQALLYETVAVLLMTPTLVWVFGAGAASSFWLSVSMSLVALSWNYSFNSVYELWEQRQAVKGRSPLRRVVHGVLFEGGLALFLIPLMAWWLHISLLAALVADLGFLAFFFIYTIAFTWVFDHIFGLPKSAKA